MPDETVDSGQLLRVFQALREGDLSVRMPKGTAGLSNEAAREYNRFLDQTQTLIAEMKRIHYEIGTEARFGGQAEVEGLSGVWKELVEGANDMSANLTAQQRDISRVITAIAEGELAKKVTVEVQGELLDLKTTINRMVDHLNYFLSELTRLSRDLGTEGKFGGQADLNGFSGSWKDVAMSCNIMSTILRNRVYDIAGTVQAITEDGDFSRKVTVAARGETEALKNHINRLVDILNAVASEFHRVSVEISKEGRSGGQAQLEKLSGRWKEMMESVNALALVSTGQAPL
ncbi:MAG TPA: HAMP domain-containing protein [Chthonomonadaceae bacterium]|nr:HAMP domain-containing protein [Chthonomonadaceae bacterium]